MPRRNSIKGFGFELLQQEGLVVVVKRIYNLIGKAHKAINIEDRRRRSACSILMADENDVL
jgi:hypothetical protein